MAAYQESGALHRQVNNGTERPFPTSRQEHDERLRHLEARIDVLGESLLFRSDRIAVVTGGLNPKLTQEIAHHLQQQPGNQAVEVFADGSPKISLKKHGDKAHELILQNVHGFAVGSTEPDINESTMRMLLTLDALKRSGARDRTAVVPFNGWGRGDKRKPGEPIAAKLFADLLKAAGAGKVITVSPHAPQEAGFYDDQLVELDGKQYLLEHITDELGTPVTLIAPDASAFKDIAAIRDRNKDRVKSIGFVAKHRREANESEALGFHCEDDIRGDVCIILDDLVDTFGSADKTIAAVTEAGAKQILIAVPHGLWSDKVPEDPENPKNGLQRLSRMDTTVYMLDTVNHREAVRKHPQIQILSSAPLIAQGIKNLTGIRG